MSEAAIVTGAASGIGRAVAGCLVGEGWDVLAVDLEPDPTGPGAPLAADLTTREGNRAAVAAAQPSMRLVLPNMAPWAIPTPSPDTAPMTTSDVMSVR